MQWISNYQLFLFDFDGLLVDTEKLHYQAYINMCAQRGFDLPWSFHRYSEAAHHDSSRLREEIYAEFPSLKAQEPNWQVLYAEKKQLFLNLIENGAVSLMPGVKELLLILQKRDICRCVVTHSPISLIEKIRKQNPVLDSIPHWITREDYTHPKPHSECYEKAIKRFGKEGGGIIGFEDSPRGLQALLGTSARPILICPPDSPYLDDILEKHKNVGYYPSFNDLLDR